jgi:hypothetical protein
MKKKKKIGWLSLRNLNARLHVVVVHVPAEGVDLAHGQEPVVDHAAQVPQALGPDEGHVLVGVARHGVGQLLLALHVLERHVVELGQELDPVDHHRHLLETLAVLGRLLAVAGEEAVEVEVGVEQGPLGLDVLELLQLPRLCCVPTEKRKKKKK